MNNASVMILDSGVGGLSIAQQIRQLCPHTPLIYIADTHGFPYGSKSATEVQSRVHKVVETALNVFSPTLVVIGCNTASTIALETLRQRFDIPFVGVVPAIKPACQVSKTKVIGVLATAGTVSTQYTQKLIEDYGENCTVHLHGAKKLALLAEKKLTGVSIEKQEIFDELDQLLAQSPTNTMDTVVLACTHFPLLLEELNSHSMAPHTWVDSGLAIAKRVQHLTSQTKNNNENQALPLINRSFVNVFCTTSTQHQYATAMIKNLLGEFTFKDLNIQ